MDYNFLKTARDNSQGARLKKTHTNWKLCICDNNFIRLYAQIFKRETKLRNIYMSCWMRWCYTALNEDIQQQLRKNDIRYSNGMSD